MTTAQLQAQGAARADVLRKAGVPEEEIKQYVGPGFANTAEDRFRLLKEEYPDAPEPPLWDEAIRLVAEQEGRVGTAAQEREARQGDPRLTALSETALKSAVIAEGATAEERQAIQAELDRRRRMKQTDADIAEAQTGPDLFDLPSSEELDADGKRRQERGQSRVSAPEGVFIPQFVEDNPSVRNYNPDATMQFEDYINAFDTWSNTAGSPAQKASIAEWESNNPGMNLRDVMLRRKRSQLGLPEPLTPQAPILFTPDFAFLSRNKKQEPRRVYGTPRFVPSR